jgi:cysteinyl-tRNA synthetase
MPLRLYNTLTRKIEPFVPADPAHVTFYSCGPTVYDDAHIGNFRSFLAADVLRRWIESPLSELATDADDLSKVHKGSRTVTHVMNITDVGHMTDDAEGGEQGEDRMAVAGKRLAEAKKSGKLPADAKIDPNDPYSIAAFYAERFRDDACKLGLKVAIEAQKDPTLMPLATANVPGMITVIKRLMDKGHAYVAGSQGARAVYFRVKSFPNYGRLSGNTLDALREGEGGRINTANQSQKEHPADFLLWKEDASHIMKWDSPWGAGYPGWHIECTVMSVNRLLGGMGGQPLRGGSSPQSPADLTSLTLPNGNPIIDLHSGGEDNIFPHHECEIAQSCCAFNASPEQGTFSTMWFHPRFLLVEGTKMSKSKGNFYTARDLFAKGIEAAAVRLELIKTNYRTNANFTFQGLQDSQRTVERWRRFIAEGKSGKPSNDATPAIARVKASFADAMHDDLNVAAAIAAINTFVSTAPSPDGASALREIDATLGVLSLEAHEELKSDIGLFIGISPDPAVTAKLEDRRAARAAKDFKKSDQIRDELADMGYQIKDVAGGKVEVRRA